MPFGRKPSSKPPLVGDELMDYAAKSLGARMCSERDLRQRMKRRAQPGPEGLADIEKTIERLRELNYLSDERFAADFARLRQENRSFGKRRVQQDLQQRGISSELVTTTIEKTYEDVDEAALVRTYMDRKRLKPPTDQKETARILRRLTAAGFSTKVIFTVLRQLKGTDRDTLDSAAIESLG